MDASDNEDYSNDVQSDDDLGYYTESEEGKQDQGVSEAIWYIIDANEISAVQVTAPYRRERCNASSPCGAFICAC